MLKLNPERAVEIPKQIILVQNFTADLMAQRPDFYLLPFGRYSWMKTGKIGKFRIRPSRVHRFSRSTGRIKLIVRKRSLCLLLLDSFFIQSLAEIWTISWGTHLERFPNDFFRRYRFVYFYVFRSPLPYFIFSLAPFFVLYMYQTGGGRKRPKQSLSLYVLNYF
jgi:hypothetical protein